MDTRLNNLKLLKFKINIMGSSKKLKITIIIIVSLLHIKIIVLHILCQTLMNN